MEEKKTEERLEQRLEDKHESDLTKKEKRLLEKQRLKEMNWQERLEYVFMYYKLQMVLILCAIGVLFIAHDIYENAKTKTLLSIGVINGGLIDSEAKIAEIEEILGCEGKYETVDMLTNYVTEQNDPTSLDYASSISFMAHVHAKDMDVLIVHEEMYESLVEENYFLEMSTVLSEEQQEIFGDALETYGLRTNAEALGLGDDLRYDPVYVGVLVNAQNVENAAKWIMTIPQ